MAVKIIAEGGKRVGKKIAHYMIRKKDYDSLMKGEEIFFYTGREIDIYFKIDPKLLVKPEKEEVKTK